MEPRLGFCLCLLSLYFPSSLPPLSPSYCTAMYTACGKGSPNADDDSIQAGGCGRRNQPWGTPSNEFNAGSALLHNGSNPSTAVRRRGCIMFRVRWHWQSKKGRTRQAQLKRANREKRAEPLDNAHTRLTGLAMIIPMRRALPFLSHRHWPCSQTRYLSCKHLTRARFSISVFSNNNRWLP